MNTDTKITEITMLKGPTYFTFVKDEVIIQMTLSIYNKINNVILLQEMPNIAMGKNIIYSPKMQY